MTIKSGRSRGLFSVFRESWQPILHTCNLTKNLKNSREENYRRILTNAFHRQTYISFPSGYTITFSPTYTANLLEFPTTFVQLISFFLYYFYATSNLLCPSARKLNFSRTKLMDSSFNITCSKTSIAILSITLFIKFIVLNYLNFHITLISIFFF
jgi:hypothetical protein